jgi:hypothetical protein
MGADVITMIWELVALAKALPAQPGARITPAVQRTLVEMRNLACKIGQPTLSRQAMPEFADPLTIAYIAIGGIAALHELTKLAPAYAEKMLAAHSGQLGLVEELIIDALPLDRAGDVHEAESFGAWPYQVAEVYGDELLRLIFANEGHVTPEQRT